MFRVSHSAKPGTAPIIFERDHFTSNVINSTIAASPELPDSAIKCHVIVSGHGHCARLKHQTPPTIQQVRCQAITARNDRDAGGLVQRLLHNLQLPGR